MRDTLQKIDGRSGECDVAVILYALSAVYFAGVMVRLMLTLTPVVCILAAVAFSKVFSIYLRDDTRQSDTTDDADEDKEKNDKYYDKVPLLVFKILSGPCNLACDTWMAQCIGCASNFFVMLAALLMCLLEWL